MKEEITESVYFDKGYDKGYSDAQEHLAQKFENMLLKIQTESYDKGYKEGANQKDNKPCVCGFWGDKK